jgi:oligopeptide/dipeptide ABC transporter ATP-binding protein
MFLEGRELTAMSGRELHPLRRRMQMIFQEAHTRVHRPRPVGRPSCLRPGGRDDVGKIVEMGSPDAIYGKPRHPYTGALLSAVPVPKASRRHDHPRVAVTGDVPSPLNPPSACRFHTRCPKAQDLCSEVEPSLEEKDGLERRAACHFPLTDDEGRVMLGRR